MHSGSSPAPMEQLPEEALQERGYEESVNSGNARARLASVTKARLKIEELSNNYAADPKLLEESVQTYFVRMKKYSEVCERLLSAQPPSMEKAKFNEWYMQNMMIIEEFYSKVAARFDSGGKDLNIGDSASVVGSAASSGRSSSSSARARVAELRAKVASEKKIEDERQALENLRIRISRREREMERQRQEAEADHLENILGRIDCISTTGVENKIKKDGFSTENAESPKHTSTQPQPAKFDQDSLISSLVNLQRSSSLPTQEPPVFDGSDSTDFIPFRLAFRRIIEENCRDDGMKYYYLTQYTNGPARELVKSCFNFRASEAFARAMKLLEDKYGNSYIISRSYLRKLEDWPRLRSEDADSLGQLALFLTSISNMMDSTADLDELNNPKEMRSVVDKLPFELVKAWRVKACCLVDMGQRLKFEHLVEFVNQQSRIVNQPIFGEIKASRDVHAPAVRPKKVYATSAPSNGNIEVPEFISEGKIGNLKNNSFVCRCCKNSNFHYLNDCVGFRKKSYEDRLKFVRDNKLCFGCLGAGHISADCKRRLKCSKCSKNHPLSLHREFSKTCSSSGNVREEAVSFAVRRNNCKVISPSVPVFVMGRNNNLVKTYVALDGWASDNFMSFELAEKLGLGGEEESLVLSTMSTMAKKVNVKQINNLKLLSADRSFECEISKISAIKDWPFTIEDSPDPADIVNSDHFSNLPFEFFDCKIGILIGINESELIKPLEIVSGEEGGPFATRHLLGWALSGPVSGKAFSRCHKIKVKNLQDLELNIERALNSDFEDIDPNLKGTSVEDKLWLQKVSSTLSKRTDGHYEVALPFKSDSVSMPNNYRQALGCLNGLGKRFLKHREFQNDYVNFMNNLIKNKFIERVPESEIRTEEGQCWFLVHHGVYHKVKNKLRVVFDCSKRNAGVSLNDHLLSGPDLINNLIGILLRFREETVAFMCDVESMFMQIKVPKCQTDFMRLFWWPDGDPNSYPVQYRLTSHTFGAISSPSVANFVLRQAALDCQKEISEEAVNTILKNAYVDDIMRSLPSSEEAAVVLKEIRHACSTAGFNLAAVVSNSRSVLNSVPKGALAANFKEINLNRDTLPSDRVLGVFWQVDKDQFSFMISSNSSLPTRRGLLSTICGIFDPLGLASPVIVTARTLFQETCRLKLDWDDVLPDDLNCKWQAWLREIPCLENYVVQRCLKRDLNDTLFVDLHVFCDGSFTAYGAVAYARYVNIDGDVVCSLIMSKTRQTPVGKSALKTVPRIELNAAKLAVIVAQTVKRESCLKFREEHYWSDSKTVLSYIRSDKARFHLFVENRVNFIRMHSSRDSWHFVPGSVNIADVCSRGSAVPKFLLNKQWPNGPDFLYDVELKFFTEPETTNKEELEVKVLNVRVSDDNDSPVSRLLYSSSDWYRLRHNVSTLLSFKSWLKSEHIPEYPFTTDFFERAEFEIWKYVQRQNFSSEIRCIDENISLVKGSLLTKLNPFLDEQGVLRVGGRLARAVEPFDARHPIVLPGKDEIVRVMIRSLHVRNGHFGLEYLLSRLKEKYYVLGSTVIIKQIVRSCVICRKLNARPAQQLMAQLPPERVNVPPGPFSSTGIDYFGPFLVRRGRSEEKRYGIVFTCLASRAVHFEVAHSLDTSSFINALRRFIARRGEVKSIFSDNGTNLVGGCAELKSSINKWNQSDIGKELIQRSIDWKFNPPSASHFGGIWEREIRTARKILYTMMQSNHSSRLNDENLLTFMCEVEAIMNSRPLTVVSANAVDLLPLTPNHLLLLSIKKGLPPGTFESHDQYCKKRWRYVQCLADEFWKRWRKEYVRDLQQRCKWKKTVPNLNVNDVVLVVESNLPRNQWCVGRISELILSKDNLVRAAKIKIAQASDKSTAVVSTKLIERPIAKIVPILTE